MVMGACSCCQLHRLMVFTQPRAGRRSRASTGDQDQDRTRLMSGIAEMEKVGRALGPSRRARTVVPPVAPTMGLCRSFAGAADLRDRHDNGTIIPATDDGGAGPLLNPLGHRRHVMLSRCSCCQAAKTCATASSLIRRGNLTRTTQASTRRASGSGATSRPRPPVNGPLRHCVAGVLSARRTGWGAVASCAGLLVVPRRHLLAAALPCPFLLPLDVWGLSLHRRVLVVLS